MFRSNWNELKNKMKQAVKEKIIEKVFNWGQKVIEYIYKERFSKTRTHYYATDYYSKKYNLKTIRIITGNLAKSLKMDVKENDKQINLVVGSMGVEYAKYLEYARRLEPYRFLKPSRDYLIDLIQGKPKWKP